MILTPSGSDPRILVIRRFDLQNPVWAHELKALRHWRCRSCRNEKWQQSKRGYRGYNGFDHGGLLE
jgi:Inner membrane component domain